MHETNLLRTATKTKSRQAPSPREIRQALSGQHLVEAKMKKKLCLLFMKKFRLWELVLTDFKQFSNCTFFLSLPLFLLWFRVVGILKSVSLKFS